MKHLLILAVLLAASACDSSPTSVQPRTAAVTKVKFKAATDDWMLVDGTTFLDLSESAQIEVDLNCPVHGWFSFTASGSRACAAAAFFSTNTAVRVDCTVYHKTGVGLTTRHDVRF